YYVSGTTSTSDTITKTFFPTRSLTYYDVDVDTAGIFPSTGQYKDTITFSFVGANKGRQDAHGFTMRSYYVYSLLKFDSVSALPSNATMHEATLYLHANPDGFHYPQYPNAHSVNGSSSDEFRIAVPSDDWIYSTSVADLSDLDPGFPYYGFTATSTNQDLTIDAMDFVDSWMTNGNKGLMLAPDLPLSTPTYATFANERSDDSGEWPRLVLKYTIPATVNDTILSTLQVAYCQACDTIIDASCKSIVADTTFNPYVTGVLGNWRGDRGYVYYGRRAESDPTTATNIRTNGAFNDFTPFWTLTAGIARPAYDTSRWVWNSVSTLYNNKGAEIENKDPLGRYNSGQYGYEQSLPVSVVQNGQYRESAFDGFEDYQFGAQRCDTACAGTRHIDFSGYLSSLDTVYKHSGTVSLKLTAGQQAALNFTLATEAQDTVKATLGFTTHADACSGAGNVLDNVKTQKAILLPRFSPFKGRRMVISAWVREQQACNCTAYTGNRIVVTFSGGAGSSLSFTPSGNIIEGWQRYESVFDIPADATSMTVSLESTASATVNFDDLRIHPFNANMKSFVYNPLNLRLMAELDENNYTTYYEYDDDGTLIRVKKETERGIKTIKETRSALQKILQ
ncbi:MAG TPA: hypothetical protein VEB42_01700, partial [Chitinophagaceae bacterium]|nr:hypothetical protein [Chitinophagaceae bacterium]